MNSTDTQCIQGVSGGTLTFWVYAIGFSFFTGEPVYTWLIMTSLSLTIVIAGAGLLMVKALGKTPANQVCYPIATVLASMAIVAIGEFIAPADTSWRILLALSTFGLIVGLAGSTAANLSISWTKYQSVQNHLQSNKNKHAGSSLAPSSKES